jgi:hypothetical protein
MVAERDYNSYIAMDRLTSPSSLECLPTDLLSSLTSSSGTKLKETEERRGWDYERTNTYSQKSYLGGWLSGWGGVERIEGETISINRIAPFSSINGGCDLGEIEERQTMLFGEAYRWRRWLVCPIVHCCTVVGCVLLTWVCFFSRCGELSL